MKAALAIGGTIAAFAGGGYWLYRRRQIENAELSSGASTEDKSFSVAEPSASGYRYAPPPGTNPLDEIEALGRTIESEASGKRYSDAERIAIGWATRNHFYRRHQTICSGQCEAHKQSGGHYAASAKAPSEHALTLADDILSRPVADPTRGALSFFEPALQDSLYRQGLVTRTADEIRAKWTGEEDKLSLYVVVGQWEFYGPRGQRMGDGRGVA